MADVPAGLRDDDAYAQGARSARLEGWKEIAAWFGRSVRTIQRWELDEQLPIRRHVHASGATVYAYSNDLAHWRASRSSLVAAAAPVNGSDEAEHGLGAEALTAISRQHWELRTKDGFKRSIALARTALQRDPTYAPAHGMLALAHVTRASYAYAAPTEDLDMATEAALACIELDPLVPEAHLALAFVSMFQWNWTRAQESFERALYLDRLSATTYQWYAMWHVGMDREAEGLRLARRAEAIAPTSPILAVHTSWVLHEMGRFDDGIEKAGAIVRQRPDFWRAYFNLAMSLAALGRGREAVRAMEVAVALNDHPIPVSLLSYCIALGGEVDRADAIMRAAARPGVYVSPYWQAYAAAGASRSELVVDLLKEAVAQGEWFMLLLKHEPAFSTIRESLAFTALVRHVGLP